MKCPNCGADIVAGQKFCNKCGFPIEKYANKTAGNQNQTAQSNPNPAPQQPVNQQPVQNNGVNQQPQQNYQPVQPTQNMGAQPNMGNVQNNMTSQPANQNTTQNHKSRFADIELFSKINYAVSSTLLVLAIYTFFAVKQFGSIIGPLIGLVIILGVWYFLAQKYKNTEMPFNHSYEALFLGNENTDQKKFSNIVKYITIGASAIAILTLFIGPFITYTNTSESGITTEEARDFHTTAGSREVDLTLFGITDGLKQSYDSVIANPSQYNVSPTDVEDYKYAKSFITQIKWVAVIGSAITLIFSFVIIKFSSRLRIVGNAISGSLFIMLPSVFENINFDKTGDSYGVFSAGTSFYVALIMSLIALISSLAWGVRQKNQLQ